MKYQTAAVAIKAILAAIDDEELPKAKIEKDGSDTIAWFGGHGRHLGTAKRNGIREPLIYRDSAAREAIELEATYRMDLKHQNATSDE